MSHVFVNNRLVTSERAKIDCRDRGFRFGDGVFETVAMYGTVPYQWELHEARMLEGLNALKIPEPRLDFRRQISRLMRKNEASDGFVRIAISRGVGSKGYRPTADCTPTVIIEHIPREETPPAPAELWLSHYCKPPRSYIPSRIKTAQGLNCTLALLEAEEHACNEALMLTHDGQLCEAASGNLFWFRDQKLHTPSLETGCLNGTTRDAILRISPYPVKHVKVWMDELKDAETVFLTNCNWIIRPVSVLKPQSWEWNTKHPIIKELQLLYLSDVKQYLTQRKQRASA
jgi:branched-chain amino acid aminotransferase